ncbi:MAG: response regulator [Draconibacterium sp.]
MSKISLIIVDDHKIFRDGLKLLLSRFSNVELIGEASDGAEFLDLLENKKPDIVFMDINMPKINGLEATKLALKRYPDLKIIILTTFLEEEYIEQMITAGVEGYMLKNSELDEFDKAINRVFYGGNYFSEEIVGMILSNIKRLRTQKKISNKHNFTPRETEILRLICKGLSNEQIAESTFVSVKTIEKHKSILFQKTNTQNTVNLVIYAFKNELIDF